MLLNVRTLNVTSVPAAPPSKPPPIVTISSTSKLPPPVLIVIVEIVPFASVAISKVAPDPANSDVPATPVNVADTVSYTHLTLPTSDLV